MAEKENRCWPGYEPVKGKKPHSEGSCRPKAESKSTESEKKFRARRREQLDQWQAEHPDSKPQAAQHLKSPDAKPMRETSSTKKASPKTYDHTGQYARDGDLLPLYWQLALSPQFVRSWAIGQKMTKRSI